MKHVIIALAVGFFASTGIAYAEAAKQEEPKKMLLAKKKADKDKEKKCEAAKKAGKSERDCK